MTKKYAFEDITILHDGDSPCNSLFSALCTALRTPTQFYTQIYWATGDDKFQFTDNGATLKKSGAHGWNNVIHSSQPLTETIIYFQAKIVELSNIAEQTGGGIFFGISRSNDTGTNDYFQTEKANCIYTDKDSLGSHTTDRVGSCMAIGGDVIGVVVDKKEDVIKFYINGSLVARGKSKPSTMQSIYAVVWVYYNQCVLSMKNYIPYHVLSDEPRNQEFKDLI
jgi:hypothetical protein